MNERKGTGRKEKQSSMVNETRGYLAFVFILAGMNRRSYGILVGWKQYII